MNSQVNKIGFIGQGWIGKNYADDFEKRGYNVVRYGLEDEYKSNKSEIGTCNIVFIAVPTPSTPEGFDDSVVRSAVKLVGEKSTAVIKSTVAVKSTESIQAENKNIFVLHSPEFLTEATAAHDAANPFMNIIGLPMMSDEYKNRAKEVIAVLPKAPAEQICSSRESELIKYGINVFFYFKVIYTNMLHDLAEKSGARYSEIKKGLANDPRIGKMHLDPIHKGGRGAGGHCFIKDFSAFDEMYREMVNDNLGNKILESIKNKNIDLLIKSNKNLDLLKVVYGEDVLSNKR